MNVIYLSLHYNSFDYKEIRISKEQPYLNNNYSFYRSSPLFKVDDNWSYNQFDEDYTGFITFLYTSQPLEVIKHIKEKGLKDKLKLYLSQGIASIIIFTTSNDIISDFSEIEHVFGTESWKIEKNKIITSSLNLPDFDKEEYFTLDLSSIGHEEASTISDIISSINSAYSYSRKYFKAYLPVLDEVKRKVVDLYTQELYITKKITFEEFKNRTESNNNPDIAKDIIDFYNGTVVEKFSMDYVIIKDELIQIASILKNSNAQFFGNIPIIESGTFQTGDNSLLGIAHNLYGFLAIYLHLKDCFSTYNFENAFLKEYKNKGPKVLVKPDDNSYMSWYSDFKGEQGLNHYLTEDNTFSSHLMVYFSNRQGFRLTKHAVSAAMQANYLSYHPSFTLNTLTHELLHAHVRSEIMVEFYPLDKDEEGKLILRLDAFEKYKEIFNTEYNHNHSINDFLQITFLQIAGIVRNGGNTYNKKIIKKKYKEEELFTSLKKWYKEIEEIIVHVLDLNYFYNSDPEYYIKAIWISWLSLPFSKNYLEDYILRSVCAISTLIETTDRLKRFDLAIKLLKDEIDKIRKVESINNSYIDIVLRRLSNKSVLNRVRFQYTNAFVHLVDITKKYFYSGGLRTLINFDNALSESEEGDYKYDLNVDKFINRTIKSPIRLINEVNKQNINNISELNGLSKGKVERNSVWLNSLIVTSLK